jgi:outer membrane protein assembly factor BamD (BamD/ComL family)
MRINYLFGVLAAAALILGCTSARNLVISEDLTPEELIQRGQEASDRNRYKVSLRYYEAILERHAANSDMVIAAEYEIAFIHYKQKKYPLAKAEMSALLERYAVPDAELLPPQFKILSEIVLERITEKETNSGFPFRKKQRPAAGN